MHLGSRRRGPAVKKTCGHGKTFSQQCAECELIWHRDMLAIAESNAERHRKAIAKITKTALESQEN